MSLIDVIAALLCLSAIFAYLNHRFIKWPSTVALMAFSMLFALALPIFDTIGIPLKSLAETLVSQINFETTLLQGLLSFLLFAGALHVNINDLREQKGTIAALATFGLLIASLLMASVTYGLFSIFGIEMNFLYCWLFGALICPTDPIAVLGLLKQAKAPKALQTKIAGESLFNDGVGVVLFLVLLGLITGKSDASAQGVFLLFCQEVLGGAAIGLGLGFLTYRLLRSIDHYQVEVLLTLALVAGGYRFAYYLHASGPIAMVVAGLMIGNHGRAFAMSEKTRKNLDQFWELIDEILNAVLFVLIGLEVLVISFHDQWMILSLLLIPMMLLTRFCGIALIIQIIKRSKKFAKNVIPIMTWGGIRGGISIALALALPPGPERDLILPITYALVAFSVIGQGLSFSSVLRKLIK